MESLDVPLCSQMRGGGLKLYFIAFFDDGTFYSCRQKIKEV
jgi:hypothetical protein